MGSTRATAGLLAAVTLIIVLAPASGGPVMHQATFSAPYKHAKAIISGSVSTGGTCRASAKVPTDRWVRATGGHTVLLVTSATGCTTPPVGNGSSSAYAYSYFTVFLPVHLRTGSHNITVNTSYDMTLIAGLAGNWACPLATNVLGSTSYRYCSEVASVSTSWGFELYDATNGSYLSGSHAYVSGPENYTSGYNDSYCYSGSCYSYNYTYGCTSLSYYADCVPSGTHVVGSNSSYLNTGRNCQYAYVGRCYSWSNWTLNGSHAFWLEVYFDAYASSSISFWGPFHTATASINAATVPNFGWKITSVHWR